MILGSTSIIATALQSKTSSIVWFFGFTSAVNLFFDAVFAKPPVITAVALNCSVCNITIRNINVEGFTLSVSQPPSYSYYATLVEWRARAPLTHGAVLPAESIAAESIQTGFIVKNPATIGLSNQVLAIRFAGNNIPLAANVTSAYICFLSANTALFSPSKLNISVSMELGASAPLYGTTHDISSRITTSPNFWSISTWGNTTFNVSPNLQSLLSQVVASESIYNASLPLLPPLTAVLQIANPAQVANKSKFAHANTSLFTFIFNFLQADIQDWFVRFTVIGCYIQWCAECC